MFLLLKKKKAMWEGAKGHDLRGYSSQWNEKEPHKSTAAPHHSYQWPLCRRAFWRNRAHIHSALSYRLIGWVGINSDRMIMARQSTTDPSDAFIPPQTKQWMAFGFNLAWRSAHWQKNYWSALQFFSRGWLLFFFICCHLPQDFYSII